MFSFIKRLFQSRKKAIRYIAIDGGNDTTLGERKVTVCSHAFHSKADAMEYMGVGDSEVVRIKIKIPL